MVISNLGGASAFHDNIALVKLQPYESVHGPLARGDGACDELPLRSEEVAVVEDAAELDCDKLIPQRTDVAVKRQSLDVHVCSAQDGRSGSLVASPRLDSNEPVLDNVDAPDPVLPAQRVELVEYLNSVGDLLVLLRQQGDFDGQARFELDVDLLRGGGRRLDGGGEFPHVRRRCDVRVFQDACFVGDVEEVLVG